MSIQLEWYPGENDAKRSLVISVCKEMMSTISNILKVFLEIKEEVNVLKRKNMTQLTLFIDTQKHL